ncbi:M16 family metallopeptidase [Rhizosphaericola mali]|uniref:M16 family metallopeptidase n=1 Tax=Rhizosphaericola mali TaxID=2545455 RepID=UPI0017839FFC|nr:pitrilysin family protein [Rhizosphaericola mali]
MIRKKVFGLSFALFATAFGLKGFSQKVDFKEYDLKNGLHVVLHDNKTAPDVAVSVMYHVGSKNEVKGRTGFAHFFEHLLFEGSDNIKRGEFMKIVAANGGQNNANTTQDRTFYYEVLPANQLKLGLWLESERMMHPVINDIGVNTQREVVKEEKRMRVDNQPYGQFMAVVFSKMFTNHPYHWVPIGSMEDINNAKLSEFKDFFKKFYVPNNAVLSISGDINIPETEAWVKSYFESIPKGAEVVQPAIEEAPITKEMIDTAYDPNIQIPAIFTAYRVPGENTKDAVTLSLLTSLLSKGESSRFNKYIKDQKAEALEVTAFNYTLEDYGLYINLALPSGNVPLDTLLNDMDAQVKDVQTNLITDAEFKKLQVQAETDFVNSNNRNIGIAENLADGYTFYKKNTGHVNDILTEIRSVTKEDIRNAARKYLNQNQRLVLYYLPKASK